MSVRWKKGLVLGGEGRCESEGIPATVIVWPCIVQRVKIRPELNRSFCELPDGLESVVMAGKIDNPRRGDELLDLDNGTGRLKLLTDLLLIQADLGLKDGDRTVKAGGSRRYLRQF